MVKPKPSELKNFNDFNEKALLQLVIGKQWEALALIFDRYAWHVYEHIVNSNCDRQTAEDLVLNLFIKLWDDPPSHNLEETDLHTWLIQQADHQITTIKMNPQESVIDHSSQYRENSFTMLKGRLKHILIA